MEKLRKFLEKTRYGYFIGTLLFALLPLPSNMLFISYGLLNAKSIGIVIGFWTGRFLVYLIMIYISSYLFNSFKEMLNSDFQTLIIMNVVGILMTLFMLLIDWDIFLSEHKLSFIKPKRFFSRQ